MNSQGITCSGIQKIFIKQKGNNLLETVHIQRFHEISTKLLFKSATFKGIFLAIMSSGEFNRKGLVRIS